MEGKIPENRRFAETYQEYLTMPCIRDPKCQPWKEYSLPLHVPGQGHLLEKMWDAKRAAKARSAKEVGTIEYQSILESKATSVNNATMKSQKNRLDRHVQLGLERAEEDLNLKRNRLKRLLLNEEADLTHEYVQKAQQYADELYKEKQKLAEDILIRQKREKEDAAKEKLEQLEKENSAELREKMSLLKKIESAEIQKHQICERKIQKMREDEFNKFWLELEKKRDAERLKFEEEEEQLRLSRIKEQREMLNKQILGKKMMVDERKGLVEKEASFVDKLRDCIKEDEEAEKQFRIQQKNELKKDRESQRDEYRCLTYEREKKEKELDDYYAKLAHEAFLRDQLLEMDTRAEQKREAEMFRQQLKEIRTVQAEEEKQVEELRMREVQKKEEVIRKNQLLLKEARDKLHRETLETWKQQVLQKEKALAAERAMNMLYSQGAQHFLDRNVELDNLAQQSKKRKEKERIKDLEWQQKYEKLIKLRLLEEEDNRMKNHNPELKHNLAHGDLETLCKPLHPFNNAIRDQIKKN